MYFLFEKTSFSSFSNSISGFIHYWISVKTKTKIPALHIFLFIHIFFSANQKSVKKRKAINEMYNISWGAQIFLNLDAQKANEIINNTIFF